MSCSNPDSLFKRHCGWSFFKPDWTGIPSHTKSLLYIWRHFLRWDHPNAVGFLFNVWQKEFWSPRWVCVSSKRYCPCCLWPLQSSLNNSRTKCLAETSERPPHLWASSDQMSILSIFLLSTVSRVGELVTNEDGGQQFQLYTKMESVWGLGGSLCFLTLFYTGTLLTTKSVALLWMKRNLVNSETPLRMLRLWKRLPCSPPLLRNIQFWLEKCTPDLLLEDTLELKFWSIRFKDVK